MTVRGYATVYDSNVSWPKAILWSLPIVGMVVSVWEAWHKGFGEASPDYPCLSHLRGRIEHLETKIQRLEWDIKGAKENSSALQERSKVLPQEKEIFEKLKKEQAEIKEKGLWRSEPFRTKMHKTEIVFCATGVVRGLLEIAVAVSLISIGVIEGLGLIGLFLGTVEILTALVMGYRSFKEFPEVQKAAQIFDADMFCTLFKTAPLF